MQPGRATNATAKKQALWSIGRVFAPTFAAWKRAGEVLAKLSATEGVPLRSFGRSFLNDVLLAASCRETGVVLVTNNHRDFTRIHQVLPFEFCARLARRRVDFRCCLPL